MNDKDKILLGMDITQLHKSLINFQNQQNTRIVIEEMANSSLQF